MTTLDLTGPVDSIVDTLYARFRGEPIPLDDVETTIQALKPGLQLVFQGLKEDHFPGIRLDVLSKIQISLEADDFVSIAEEHKPWLDSAILSKEIELTRWYSYKRYLRTNAGFTPAVIDVLDRATTEIVDYIGDPRQSGSWKRRGLVIGDVQSGKTATYIGVLNKAADAGYKLIILLAGGTESLRKQTQFRVDDGLIGVDSSVDAVVHRIGVGNLNAGFVSAQGLTTQASDFNQASKRATSITIDPNSPTPYVFVLKKNKTALENVIAWLKGQKGAKAQLDVPMLLVDDESDYASIDMNYGKATDIDPTLINQRIRELLTLATKSSYMAFTATPFANVFIDHESQHAMLQDDLFPSDYIYALASPSNYMGAHRYFEAEDPESLVYVRDALTVFPFKHKSHLAVHELPESLLDSLNTFIAASAIRELRGDTSPRAMLVNVSRFKRVQAQVHELLADELAAIKSAVELHSGSADGDSNPSIARVRESFVEHYGQLGVAWDDVRQHLLAAVNGLSVQLINSDRVKEEDGRATRRMIAVGGDVLSRGLTLDGLTVSYFYRTVGAADTLMQMARWFGYRPGYDDLVRVWIDEDVAAQFTYVAQIVTELRAQLAEMNKLKQLPRDFGLAIRKHPESLAITAKRGASESKKMVISLAARNIETPRLPADATVVLKNYAASTAFLRKIEEAGHTWGKNGRHRGVSGVSRQLIADFLESFTFDSRNLVLGGSSLSHAIRNSQAPKFENWNVCLIEGSGSSLRLTASLELERQPRRTVRLSRTEGGGVFKVGGNSIRVAGSADVGQSFDGTGSDLEEPAVYEHLPAPTLFLYFIDPAPLKSKKGDAASVKAAAEETGEIQSIMSAAANEGGEALVALKVAIQGRQGDGDADVTYQVSSAWIARYRAEFGLAQEDIDDLDA